MKKVIATMFTVTTLTAFAQVGIGTETPHASAALEVSSTNKGFLPPRLTETQMNSIASPAEGLIVFCFDCSPKGIYFFNGSNFASISNTGLETGLASGEVLSTTGKIWLDKNLGARQVAISSSDFNAYGDLYQWGRSADGHQVVIRDTSILPNDSMPAVGSSGTIATIATSSNPGHGDYILTTSGTDNNWANYGNEDDLWQNGFNDPCPTGYRLPTEAELGNERLHFSTNNASGAFNSPLKLPTAGARIYNDGLLNNVGVTGRYWSSTVDGVTSRNLRITANDAYTSSYPRGAGFSVRCIKDE
ncbi:fibrobacter succinogenes major paralogous domain-containing protein [Pseudotamlana agarivorans]|uniref:FISUMP domain-containing protein n=1 Tax=Pseudotamlana agarivorans TaxID=481183 RepID=UPI000833453A|nr:FISUMP domain-containing protein [Tamlana agarivorans]